VTVILAGRFASVDRLEESRRPANAPACGPERGPTTGPVAVSAPVPLRVLIVEDSEADAGLVLDELELGGYDVQHERVDTAEAMVEALARTAWDIVLSDYTMPSFSGLEAIEVLKASGRDIPLIIISGAIGEETAVGGMRAGARDYLLKSNLRRLAPAVQRELREAADRCRASAAGERHEEQLIYLANHDDLTGLPNRNLLEQRLRLDILRNADAGKGIALLALDLDGFRAINEGFGHEIGDAVLKHVAQRLTGHLREADTIARLGGDRFCMVLSDLATSDPITAIGRQLLAAIAEPIVVDGYHHLLSGSIGVAVFPEDGSDAPTLLKHVDSALNHAKRLGRNTLQFFSAELNAQQIRRRDLERDLRSAFERRELWLAYQPQVDLRSGSVFGFEALLRWTHAEQGPVSPVEFVPIAEECGLIVPIGEWVFETACRQLREWDAAGFGGLRIGVNLSVRQVARPELAATFARIIAATGVDPSQIELELTENTLLAAGGDNAEQLAALRRLGVTLSIDDFGTGYCNFSYLRQFPVDWVKIDRSFVQGITTHPADAAIYASIIQVAHALGLRVMAEGVEGEGELQALAAYGCDAIQGFLFSRPLAAADALALLREGCKLAIERDPGARERTLLLVDDEPNIATALKRVLRREGYRILIAGSAQEGFEQLAKHRVGVVISDQRMPNMNGTEFLRKVKDLYPDTVRLVLSGYTDLQSVTSAINEGAIYKFLTKPWDDQQLLENVREAFHRQELAAENVRLSSQIKEVNQRLEAALAAQSDQLEKDETVLDVAHETLAAIPVPVLGIDPSGMIAISNAAGDALLGGGASLVGSYARERLPQRLLERLADIEDQGCYRISIAGQAYRLVRRSLGLASLGEGALLVLLPESEA